MRKTMAMVMAMAMAMTLMVAAGLGSAGETGGGKTARPAVVKPVAGRVYLSSHGRTYHTFRDCVALRRSRTVLEAQAEEAEKHGLALCGICERRRSGGGNALPGAGNGAWARAAEEK